MDDKTLLGDATVFIAKDFNLQKIGEIMHKDYASQLDLIRDQLIERIRHLLDTDFEKLMSILYRIDVDEAKVKHAFATCTNEQVPPVLADLVIERQLRKVRTRYEYKMKSQN